MHLIDKTFHGRKAPRRHLSGKQQIAIPVHDPVFGTRAADIDADR
jgi:hypothetical protein